MCARVCVCRGVCVLCVGKECVGMLLTFSTNTHCESAWLVNLNSLLDSDFPYGNTVKAWPLAVDTIKVFLARARLRCFELLSNAF